MESTGPTGERPHHSLTPEEFRARREHAWGYFQVHAAQRLTTFNFFIILASLLTTALLASLQRQEDSSLIPVAPGFLLGVFAFVFARLDDRTRQLIRNGEDALVHLERHWPASASDPAFPPEAVFSRDAAFVERQRQHRHFWRFWKNHLSYRDCFRFAFLSFGLLGLGSAVLSLTLYLYSFAF